MVETFYTPEEAAARMRVSQRTVYTWLRNGELRGLKAGRAWRIRHEDIQAFMERHARGGPKYDLPGPSRSVSTPPQTDRAARARAARGRFAYLKSGSDEFAARKQEEIEREARRG